MDKFFKRLAWVLWRRRRFGDQAWRLPILETVILIGGSSAGTPMVLQGVTCIVYPYWQASGGFGQIEYMATDERWEGRRVFVLTPDSFFRHELDAFRDPRIMEGIR